MHITINKEVLLDQLELVGRVSTKHVTLPVLQCVLLEVVGQKLVLRATNLEIAIESTCDVTTHEEGVVAVSAAVITQTVQYISQRDVTLRVEEGVLVIESEGSQTSIKIMPHEEFPTVPKIKKVGQVVNRSLFALGIKTVSFAASQVSIKPELGSVYCHQTKEHSLTFVATDSFRLMEKTVIQKGVVLEDSILIPQKNAIELAKVCDMLDSDPEFMVDENQCALQFSSGVYITSRLTTGSFPDYNQIIPKEYSTHATLLKNDLQQAFKKTNIFLNKFQQVSMQVVNNAITISANSGEVGATTESISAQVKGEDISLSFNQRYIADAFIHFSDESIVMHFAGIGRPMVVNNLSDESLRYLVMPMNK